MRKILLTLSIPCLVLIACSDNKSNDEKIIDVHVHSAVNAEHQIAQWKQYNVEKVFFSSSWDQADRYKSITPVEMFTGLMIPCPNGIVPYSGQTCYDDQQAWPDSIWVKHLLKKNRIQFLGEVLTQYAGLLPDNDSMLPYYRLAAEFKIPVGFHTGLAGPGHLCPQFDSTMGNPALLRPVLQQFPGLKIWLMHAGGPYFEETLRLMNDFPNVYVDISVLNNPQIIPPDIFHQQLQQLLDAGMEDRIMFGSDNGDYDLIIPNMQAAGLSRLHYAKIMYKNALAFFASDAP